MIFMYVAFSNNNDECVCYNDYLNIYDLPKYTNDIQDTLAGNWNSTSERGIGLKNVYYKPGDTIAIQIQGDASFQDTVKNSIITGATPFINLNFTFVNDSSAPFKIIQGTPPPGYTGWTSGI